MKRIGIIGAGAWGTALAMVVRRAGREAMIWALEPEVVAAVNGSHENASYLPGVALDREIVATNDLAEAVNVDALLLAVPTQFLRAACAGLAVVIKDKKGLPVIICTKGIEQQSNALPSEIVNQILARHPVAVLSGPTFAVEVARGLPAAVTLACADAEPAAGLAEALGSAHFRIYVCDDVIGAQVGGAVKNVLAIAAGIVEGRGMGDNARAALITRGLAEIARLNVAKGGKAETLMGLSGIGDLILTCNAMQSRNFSLGAALGKGGRLKDILDQRRSVAEGVATASSVSSLARSLNIDMPICLAVDGILHGGLDIDRTIAGLLARRPGNE